MQLTEQTAIVLRYANYRENDRMLTLLSPTHGLVEALARGCRKPRSSLLNASELFALGEYQLYEKAGRYTVVSVALTETFHPLRADYERLSAGIYLLNLAEMAAQPGRDERELFLLLVHSLSRLTFSDQPWRPLLAGFLLHYSNIGGFKPRLDHCALCGERLAADTPVRMDFQAGGLACPACARPGQLPVTPAQAAWLRQMLRTGSAGWLDTAETKAPYALLRRYVELALDQTPRSGSALPWSDA